MALFYIVLRQTFPFVVQSCMSIFFLKIVVSIPFSFFVSRTSKYVSCPSASTSFEKRTLECTLFKFWKNLSISSLESNAQKISSTYRQSMWGEHPILLTLSTNQFINTSAIRGNIFRWIAVQYFYKSSLASFEVPFGLIHEICFLYQQRPCPISGLQWNPQECLWIDFLHQMSTLFGYDPVHGQLLF